MAEKILSQEEVDALLRGVESGAVDTTAKSDEQEPARQYDFGAQGRSLRGRMPTFELINDRFSRRQSISWTGTLRRPVELSPVTMQLMKYGEFLKQVPMPSSLNVFRMDPLRGHGLVVMNASLVYALVDQFFGGNGLTSVTPEARDFTPIQQRIIKTILERTLDDLAKAWQAVIPVKIQMIRSETNPQFAMMVPATEMVVVVLMKVDFGDATQDLSIVYPYAMIEQIKDKLYAGVFSDLHQEQDSSWIGRLKSTLRECPVEVTVQLGTATVRVKDMLNFTPGDVLVLEQSPGDLMLSRVEGVSKFRGTAGIIKGKRAYRIAHTLQ